MFVFFTENRLSIRLRLLLRLSLSLSLNLRLCNQLFLDTNTSLNCLKMREKIFEIRQTAKNY